MVSEIVPPPPALRDSGLAGQCRFNGVSAIQRGNRWTHCRGTYARALRTGMKTTDTRIHPESTVRTEMGAKPVETLDTDNYEFLKTPYSGPKHPIFRAETSDIQGRNIRYSGPRHPIFRAETSDIQGRDIRYSGPRLGLLGEFAAAKPLTAVAVMLKNQKMSM